MDPERTFGVEIECVSKIDRPELASKIAEAVAAFGHTCSESGWHRNTDGTNFTHWEVKTDSTVHTHNPNEYPFDRIEIVSPILKGNHGLAVLKAVCGVTETYCTANKTCGLHIHHGILPTDNIGNIIIGWLRAEDTIYQCIPKSRREGNYAVPLKKKATYPRPRYTRRGRIRSGSGNPRTFTIPERIDDPATWWSSNIASRQVGLNLESYWMRGTIEVRAAAGTVEYTKISNWAKVTQKLIVRASLTPQHFSEGINNLAAALCGAVVVVGIGPSGDFNPSRNCGRGYAFWRLLESDEPLDIHQLELNVALTFGKDTSFGQNRVKKALALAKKSGYVVTKTRDGRANIEYPQVTRIEEVYFEPDEVVWLRGRHRRFREVV